MQGITIQICTVIRRLLFFHCISEIGRPKKNRDGCRQQRNQRKAQARSSRSLRETPLPSSSYALVALFQLRESPSNLLTGRPTSMPQTERRSGGWPGLWQGDWEQDCLWMGWTWRCIGYGVWGKNSLPLFDHIGGQTWRKRLGILTPGGPFARPFPWNKGCLVDFSLLQSLSALEMTVFFVKSQYSENISTR